MKMKENVLYAAQGFVVGKDWMGGIGTYDSECLTAKTFEELKEKAAASFESGHLEDGFGFEKLLAAKLRVVKNIEAVINGKTYTRREYLENMLIGDEKYLKMIHL